MTVTAEQLEELLRQCGTMEGRWWKVERGLGRPTERMVAQDFLKHLAPYLARKVIAAEKLVEVAEKASNLIEGSRAFDAAMEELVECAMAYREASK